LTDIKRPSQFWDGVDGQWTSFSIQAGGQRSQILRLYPSFSLSEVYAIHPNGCPDNSTFNGFSCDLSRGGIYNHSASLTYVDGSKYKLGDYATFRNYGFDQLTGLLGWESFKLSLPKAQDDQTTHPDIEHVVIAQISDYKLSWLGLFGLDIRPSNLSELGGRQSPQANILSTLKRQNMIPSLSWAYTAGSRWHGRGSQGSLTLGGYDERRMIRNEVEFPFGEDSEKRHLAWVESVVWTEQSRTFSFDASSGSNYTTHIDPTQPFIYFPSAIYDELSTNPNFQYDNHTSRLIVTDDKIAMFKTKAPQLKISITPLDRLHKPGQSVEISLPTESLLQRVDYPIAQKNQSLWYVPIRRANDSSQYVLGRAFLQNAYLVSDYERNSYSMHQATVEEGNGPDPLIHPILMSKSSTLESWKTSSHHLSQASIAGIATGASLATILIIVWIFICVVRRRRRNAIPSSTNSEEAKRQSKIMDNEPRFQEIGNGLQKYEASGTSRMFEADSSTEVFEVEAIQAPVEMSGDSAGKNNADFGYRAFL
jgi:hypothetical protein